MKYMADVARVVYRGQADHIYELSIHLQQGWVLSDMSAALGAPAAAGDPMGYFARVPRVVYRGVNSHVYELFIDPELRSGSCST